jgi:tetratricopeptide (TPR) repeat protein
VTASEADTAKVYSLLRKADSFKRVNSDSMRFYAQKALEHSNRINSKIGKGLSKYSLASAMHNQGNNPEARTLVLDALKIIQDEGTDSEKANALNLLGLTYMSEGKYLQADSAYKLAFAAFEKAGDNLGKAKIYHNLGVVAFYMNNIEESVSYYLQAIREADKMGDQIFSALVNTNLGLLFSSQEDYGRAILYLRKALVKHSSINDPKGKAKTLTGLGTAFFNLVNYDSSFVYHQKALLLFNQTGDLAGKSESLSNIAEILIEQKRFKEALPMLNLSDSLRRAFGNAYGIAINAKNFGKIYSGLGEYQKAKERFDDAFKQAETLQASWLMAEILLSRSGFYESTGNYEKALQDFKMRSIISEQIYSDERSRITAELETRYKAEKSRADLAIRESEILHLEEQSNRLLILVVSVILIALLGGLLAFQIYKRNSAGSKSRLLMAAKDLEIEKKQKELEESRREAAEKALVVAEREQMQIKSELDYKKRELTQLALYINQQNEILEALKNEISTLKSGDARKLERELEQRINISKQRESFEMNVDLMNEDFYHRLFSKYPHLTENDKKLCAMVRLGLSSKEIASIVNISPKSVDMNRYRLRKKMDLEAEEELGNFLMTI